MARPGTPAPCVQAVRLHETAGPFQLSVLRSIISVLSGVLQCHTVWAIRDSTIKDTGSTLPPSSCSVERQLPTSDVEMLE